jgi:hypothetical protein
MPKELEKFGSSASWEVRDGVGDDIGMFAVSKLKTDSDAYL